MAATTLVTITSCLIGCSSSQPSSAAPTTTPPSTTSPPLSTATNPAAVATSLYVATDTQDQINIFAANANGNVDPTGSLDFNYCPNVSIFSGGCIGYLGLAADTSGNIYASLPVTTGGTVYEYGAGANPTTPVRTIQVGSPGLQPDALAVDMAGNLYVLESSGVIEIVPPGASAPTATLSPPPGSPYTEGATDLKLDREGNIYVVYQYGPQPSYQNGFTLAATNVVMYPAGSSGTVAPTIVIPPSYWAHGICFDAAGNLYVTQYGGTPPIGIYVFAPGSTANSTPIRSITGAATEISEDGAWMPIAVDSGGNIFISSTSSTAATILVFSSTATGNVAPASVISSPSFLQYPFAILLR